MNDRDSIDYTVLAHPYRSDAQTAVRAWEPGDGVRCTWTGRNRVKPCGRPVAVVIVREEHGGYGGRPTTIRRVVCVNHLPGLKPAGEATVEAAKAAAERVITDHWDEYQAHLKAESERRLAERFEFADEAIRALVLKALADEEQQ